MRFLPLQLRRAGQDQVHRHHDRDSARLLPAAPSQVRSQLLSHLCRAVRLIREPLCSAMLRYGCTRLEVRPLSLSLSLFRCGRR